jgi:hypothetical protein
VYDVRLSMMILSHDGTAEVGRRLNLPFAPFAGLLLDFEDDGDCAHVAVVQWSVAAGCFRVQCQPYDERDLSPEDQTSVREWLAYYLRRGWHTSLTPESVQGADRGTCGAAPPDEAAGS